MKVSNIIKGIVTKEISTKHNKIFILQKKRVELENELESINEEIKSLRGKHK